MAEIKNFITEYLRLSERAESPTSFLKWGAISCLSAALRDNVYFSHPERGTRLYPNTYILIVGDSSVVRKSAPFDINNKLLRGIKGVNNTKVIAGSATMQGVLKALAETSNGQPLGGSGLMLAKEMSGFFIQDPMTIGTLTDLYDYHELYDKHLASYELPPIKNVCLSMFAATNEIMMKKLMDITAIQGGFLGRCIVITEKRRRHSDSGFEDGYYPKEDDWEPLVTFLRKLNTIKGPLVFTEDARITYNKWYKDFPMDDFETKTGFEGRLASHIQKLSVILTASKPNFECKVHVPELEEAIEMCVSLLQVYKRLTFGSGIAPTANYTLQTTEQLLKARDYTLTRMQLLVNLHGNVTGVQLDEILKDLGDAGFVKEFSKSGVAAYQLTDKFIQMVLCKAKAKSRGHAAD